MSELYTKSVYFSDFKIHYNVVLTGSANYLSSQLLYWVSLLQLGCKEAIKTQNARSFFVWRGLAYVKKWDKYMYICSYRTVTY